MEVGRWILKRIDVSDSLRKEAMGTDRMGCGPLMGCSLQEAIADILSRRNREGCGQAAQLCRWANAMFVWSQKIPLDG